MSFTTTSKKSKCIKCLSDKFASKSTLHAQNQNGKQLKRQTINILKLLLTLITALKSTF